MTETFDVIIVGAGYGGLMAASRLLRRGGAAYKVAVLAPDSQFSERIRWHESLSTDAEPPNRALDIRAQVERLGGRFIETRVDRIERETRHIIAGAQRFGYRKLVLAIGSTAQSNLPGVAEHAFVMDRDGPNGALALRRRLAILRGTEQPYHAAIVGSGPTGLEIAGEIAADPEAQVTVISGGAFAAFAAPGVASRLHRIAVHAGVRIQNDEYVCAVEPDGLVLASGRLTADVVIWCGGLSVAGPSLSPPLSRGTGGRIYAGENLNAPTDRDVYLVGDTCLPMHDTGAPPRMSALFALTTGAYVADHIAGRRRRPFRFSAFGQGIQFGRSGVGFAAFPFDRALRPYFTGRAAFALRQFFVHLLFRVLVWQAKFGALPIVIRPPARRNRCRKLEKAS